MPQAYSINLGCFCLHMQTAKSFAKVWPGIAGLLNYVSLGAQYSELWTPVPKSTLSKTCRYCAESDLKTLYIENFKESFALHNPKPTHTHPHTHTHISSQVCQQPLTIQVHALDLAHPPTGSTHAATGRMHCPSCGDSCGEELPSSWTQCPEGGVPKPLGQQGRSAWPVPWRGGAGDATHDWITSGCAHREYCPLRNYDWISSGKGKSSHFWTFFLEFLHFRLIPVMCPARKTKPEIYWKRLLIPDRAYPAIESAIYQKFVPVSNLSEIHSWKHLSGSAIILVPTVPWHSQRFRGEAQCPKTSRDCLHGKAQHPETSRDHMEAQHPEIPRRLCTEEPKLNKFLGRYPKGGGDAATTFPSMVGMATTESLPHAHTRTRRKPKKTTCKGSWFRSRIPSKFGRYHVKVSDSLIIYIYMRAVKLLSGPSWSF